MHIPYSIEQIFYPVNATCHLCKSENVYKYGLCVDCFKLLKKPEGNRCEICMDRIDTEGLCSVCFKKKPDFTRLYSSYVYQMPLSTLVVGLKRSNKRYLRYTFAEIALDTVPKEILDKINLITSVPTAPKRLKRRGYNQAELLGRELSNRTNIPYEDILIRLKETETTRLKKDEREKALKSEYSFSKSLKGETVLLIDDVCTTGATLRQCAKMLKKAGAKEVFCYTVARTELKN